MKESLMKEWNAHERNEDKEVEILDFNDKQKKKRRDKTKTSTRGAKYEQSRQMQTPRKEKNERRTTTRNKEYAIVTYVFLALFICMTGWIIYFMQFKSEDFINNSYNARLAKLSDYTVRGDILANDGTVLATTNVDEAGNETRKYPYGSVFAHAVGYSVNGMSGVELDANYNLLRSNAFILTRIFNEIRDEKNPGDDVVTTLDVSLQQACYDAMGSQDGAAIVIDPATGKILAMVSKPDYDPNTIAQNWDSYVAADSDSTVLLNRATQGLYAPGSTFKIFTLLSYLKQGNDPNAFSYDCNGTFEYNNYAMHCYNNKAHGSENLMDAFGNSCNCAFSNIGLSLDLDAYHKLCQKMLFNQDLPTALKNTAVSKMTLEDGASSSLIMQTAIGQGDTMVSPLHMAMVASAIANNGTLMEPYIIDHTQNESGTIVKQFDATSYGELLSSSDAATLQEYMRFVVTNGTGSVLNSDLYEAYGKTGTAEFSSNKNEDHSWFVGFAKNAEGKQIAVAVVMEGVESGGHYAVPATKKIFDAYFGAY